MSDQEPIILPVQAPDGYWGRWEMPSGKDPRYDPINIAECRFLGVLYRESVMPMRPAKTASDEEMAAYNAAREKALQDMERDDAEIAFADGRLVTLVPLDENGR